MNRAFSSLLCVPTAVLTGNNPCPLKDECQWSRMSPDLTGIPSVSKNDISAYANTALEIKMITETSISVIEQVTLRKVMTRLLPFLLICYAIAFIDRTNISIASLQMNADIGLSDTAYGLGAGIFFLSYTILEVPSNRILARIGARLWIARIMVSWGIATILMAFVVDEWTFYLGRFLLGACEAGFYPGVIYYLTRWFPRAARGRAFSLFQIGGPIAFMIGTPLAGSLLELDGSLGFAGWQWVFVVTGAPAIVFGFLVLIFLTDSPSKAKWLDGAQKEWLTGKLADEGDDGSHASTPLKVVLHNRIVWLTCGINFFIIMSLYGVSMWLPRTVQALTGADNLAVSFLSAIPYIGAVIVTILASRLGDKIGQPQWITFWATVAGGIGLVITALNATSPVISMLGLCIASAGIYGSIPSMWSLSTARMPVLIAATSIGFISAVGNVGGFVGPYVAGIANTMTGNSSVALMLMGLSLFIASGFTLMASRTKPVVFAEKILTATHAQEKTHA